MAKKKQATPLSSEAIDALRAADFSANQFRLSDENLDCYSEIKALVTALGGKWISAKRVHQFAESVDAESLISAACDRGEIPATNPGDFFPTPQAIVDMMVGDENFESSWESRLTIAELEERPVRYLEPSGGAGALASAMAHKMRPNDVLVIVEKDPLLAASLRKKFPQAEVIEGDFLDYKPDEPFDVILMNPPFAGKLYQKHILHASGMLKSLGILSAVAPSSFLYHDLEFVFTIAEGGNWQTLGKKRFEGTDCDTSILWFENDGARFWRNRPSNGYSTHHAYELAVSFSTDQLNTNKLAARKHFKDAVPVLEEYAKAILLNHQTPIRVDESVAREVIISLVKDYSFENLAHLLPEKAAVTAEQRELFAA